MSNKLTKYEIIKELAQTMAPLAAMLIIFGILAYPAYKEKEDKRKERERREQRLKQRATQFAEYIIAETSEAAKNPHNWVIEYYRRNPDTAEKLMRIFREDSAAYVKAIFKDADLALYILEKRAGETLTFQEAVEHMAQEKFQPMGPHHIGDEAYNLKLNIKSLKNISIELAAIRKSKDTMR